jgi:hypothetical protein
MAKGNRKPRVLKSFEELPGSSVQNRDSLQRRTETSNDRHKRLEEARKAQLKHIASLSKRASKGVSRVLRSSADLPSRLNARQRALADKFKEYTHVNTVLISRNFEKNPLPVRQVYEAAFASAVERLNAEEHPHDSLEMLSDIADDWANGSDVPNDIGRKAYQLTKHLSRNWAAAHAGGYENIREGSRRFRRGKDGYGIDHTGVRWSGVAVKKLGMVGELDDMIPIRKIEASCGEGAMEGYCADARRQILAREVAKHALKSVGKKKLGIKGKVGDERVARRFGILFTSIGLDHVIRTMPGFRMFDVAAVNPVSQELEARDVQRLLDEKSRGRFKFWSRNVIPSGPSPSELDAAEKFLVQEGMIKPYQASDKLLTGQKGKSSPLREPTEYVLTDKGKSALHSLFSEISKMSVGTR